MTRMIKRLAIGLGLLVVVVIAAMAAAVLLIDPNDHRDRISDIVRDATGRELEIVDNMQLSVFPWIGVELGEVRLGNAEGFGPEPFARIASGRVKVRLVPLLSRRVEVDTVRVNGLEVHLVSAADGRNNWDDLAGAPAADGEAERAGPPAERATALPAMLTIAGLDVRDAALYWRDEAAGTAVEVTGLNLASDRIEADRPIDLRMDFDFHTDDPDLSGRLDIATRVTARLDDEFFLVEPLRVNGQFRGETLPASPLDASFNANIGIDLRREIVEIPAFSLAALGLDIDGSVQGQEILDEPRFSGNLRIAEFSPRALLEILTDEPPETADPDALTRAALDLGFRLDPERAEASDIDLRFDDSRLTGNASADGLDTDMPAIVFELALDRIDVDRYLAPEEEVPVATPATAPAAALEMPAETLRALDLNGSLTIDDIRAAGLSMTEFRLETRAKDGVITVHPIGAVLYGGRYSGHMELDVRDDIPAFSIDEAVTGVHAEPLLKDMLDLDLVSGTGDFRITATTRGTTDEELRRNARGDAGFLFRDGAIQGLNTAQLIREATARLQGREVPPAETRETDFTELTGTLKIADGIVRNEDLRGSSPYLRLTGNGEVDIIKEHIDYRLLARIVDTDTGQGAGLDDVRGVDIPIRITGPLMEPRIGVDADFLTNLLRETLAPHVEELQQELQREIDERRDELRREGEERLEQQLRRLLR